MTTEQIDMLQTSISLNPKFWIVGDNKKRIYLVFRTVRKDDYIRTDFIKCFSLQEDADSFVERAVNTKQWSNPPNTKWYWEEHELH